MQEAPAGEEVASSEGTVQRTFARFSHELWMFISAVVLLHKAALLGAMGVLWLMMIDETGRGFTQHDLVLLLAMGCGTVLLVLALSAVGRKWLLGTLTTALLATGYVAGMLIYHGAPPHITPGTWSGAERLWMLAVGSGSRIAAGGVIGIGLYYALRRLIAPMRTFPLVNETPGEPSSAINAWLTRMEGMFSRGMTGLRVIVLGAAPLLLALACYDDLLKPGPRDALTTGGYMLIGVVIGIVYGVLLLPMPLWRAMAMLGIPLVGAMVGAAIRYAEGAPAEVTSGLLLLSLMALGLAMGFGLARTLIGWIVRAMPRVVRRHVGGETDSEPVTRRVALVTCERCGYELQGLPPVRCEACGTDELRCPECGHVQPATTTHGPTVLKLCKWNVAVRVLTWLHALPLIGLPLVLWYIMGAEVLSSPRALSEGEIWPLMAALSLLILMPTRVLLLHWRLGWLVTLALPLGAVLLGGVREGVKPYAIGILLAIWVPIIAVIPLLWRLWLRYMYRADGRKVFGWQTMPAISRRAVDPELWVAESEPLTPCCDCGVLRHPDGMRSVSEASVLLAGMAARARLMVMALAAGLALAALVVLTLILDANMGGTRWRSWDTSGSSVMTFIWLATIAAGVGAWVRLCGMRHHVAVGMVAAAIWHFFTGAALLLAVAPMRGDIATSLALCAMVGIGSVAGAAIALPLARLGIHVLMPDGETLWNWLRARP